MKNKNLFKHFPSSPELQPRVICLLPLNHLHLFRQAKINSQEMPGASCGTALTGLSTISNRWQKTQKRRVEREIQNHQRKIPLANQVAGAVNACSAPGKTMAVTKREERKRGQLQHRSIRAKGKSVSKNKYIIYVCMDVCMHICMDGCM